MKKYVVLREVDTNVHESTAGVAIRQAWAAFRKTSVRYIVAEVIFDTAEVECDRARYGDACTPCDEKGDKS